MGLYFKGFQNKLEAELFALSVIDRFDLKPFVVEPSEREEWMVCLDRESEFRDELIRCAQDYGAHPSYEYDEETYEYDGETVENSCTNADQGDYERTVSQTPP
jgi:hypothetical protein